MHVPTTHLVISPLCQGFNVETVEYKNISFALEGRTRSVLSGGTVSDKGVLAQSFPKYTSSYLCHRFERLGACLQGKGGITKDAKLRDALLLVFANKQDLPNANASEITDKLQALCQWTWYIQVRFYLHTLLGCGPPVADVLRA